MSQWNVVYVIGTIFIIIFIIWLFAGNNNKYEFVGVSPLLNVDNINISEKKDKELLILINKKEEIYKKMNREYDKHKDLNKLNNSIICKKKDFIDKFVDKNNIFKDFLIKIYITNLNLIFFNIF